MRAALRLLASVQRSSQFLEPGAPTGLTGLLTHASPRSTLLYIYHSTLEKLKEFPEHSVYRQSTEALTKYRMSIIEQVKPAGLEEWQGRVKQIVDQHPDAFRKIPTVSKPGDYNVVWKEGALKGYTDGVLDDEFKQKPMLEGVRSEKERANQHIELAQDIRADHEAIPQIESEPSLSVEQVNEIESKIGAGLLEEVIQVAEGEKTLVETMLENKVWEDLEEKPQPGQWKYFERDTHTGETQAP